jgi:hypothetical protein
MNPLAAVWSFLNLPVAEAVEKFYHSRSEDWVADFAPSDSTRKLDVGKPVTVLPNEHYVTVTCQKTVLAYDRVLLQTFYAAAHSTIILMDGVGEPRTLTSFKTLSPDLLSLDKNAGERLVQGPRILLDCVPFRGSGIGATIALLAVEAANYSKPLLSTLEKLSDIAGVGYFASAKVIAEPLILGIQGLSRAGGGVQIAYAGNLPLRTGVFLIAALNRVDFEWTKYTFASEYSLLFNGIPVTDKSYMVVTVEVSTERPTWTQIPELKAAASALSDAVLKARTKIFDATSDERKEVEGALANLQWQCVSSPELCAGDGVRIARACKERILSYMNLATGGLANRDRVGNKDVGFSLDEIQAFPRPTG